MRTELQLSPTDCRHLRPAAARSVEPCEQEMKQKKADEAAVSRNFAPKAPSSRRTQKRFSYACKLPETSTGSDSSAVERSTAVYRSCIVKTSAPISSGPRFKPGSLLFCHSGPRTHGLRVTPRGPAPLLPAREALRHPLDGHTGAPRSARVAQRRQGARGAADTTQAHLQGHLLMLCVCLLT